MTAFIDLVRSRRSIRRFLPRAVEREKITACLEAARMAPSAHNAQPWRFFVVDDPGLRDRLCEKAFRGIYRVSRFAAQAPVVIVVLVRKDIVVHFVGRRIQGTTYHLIDSGIAGEHLVLQAEELGLGTCWMGWFSRRGVRRALGLPRRYKVVAMIPLGYPASRPPRETERMPLDEVAWWNGLGEGAEDGECGKGPTPER
ncbi:MAG TPA: nitroreductase family protein [Terriglobales bacterium]|nr:nitroreductase family protein [Terriglobales bacterium]